jgi:hypothetical protein
MVAVIDDDCLFDTCPGGYTNDEKLRNTSVLIEK